MSDRSLDISILIPTKNEEVSVAQFMKWCHEGISKTGLEGEVILLDSSDDRTPEIAKEMGALVVRVTQPGLGNAYRAGKKIVRGNIVIMGDADCTYDFRNIAPFIEKIQSGYDLVLGNRFIGSIEKGSMPIHHRYFGSPITSWIFKKVLKIPTGDIHCGIRALTSSLYSELPFTENGWEYASEMIAGSRNLNARITEIPVDFYKEPAGRVSHQKRNGWLTPFRAGWGTLRVTTTFSFDRIFTIPGAILSVFFLTLGGFLAIAPGSLRESLQLGFIAQFIFFACSVAGSLAFTAGILAHFIYYKNSKIMDFLSKQKYVERLFAASALLGISLSTFFGFSIYKWVTTMHQQINYFQTDTALRINSFAIFLTSLTIAVISLLVVSMVSNYLFKLKEIAIADNLK